MREPFSEKRNLRSRLTIGGIVILMLAAAFFASGCVGNNTDKASVSSPYKDSIIGAWAKSDSNGIAGMKFDKAGMVKLVVAPVGEGIDSMTGIYRFIDSDRLEMKFSIKEDPGYISRTYKVISVSNDILILRDEKEDANIILERLDLGQ